MIHASKYEPRVIPVFCDSNSAEIDRLQELTGTSTLNRTKIEEIGRVGLVDWRKATPAVSLTLRQLEYGTLEFWRKLANKGDSVVTIEMTDFKTSAVDIAGYKTDDNGTFLGTIWYPKLRLSGLGLSIGDPDALIERTFTLVGEDEKTLLENNKYLIEKRYALSAGTNVTQTISNPVPIADPDNSGQYLFRVVRIRSGVGTELTHGTEWSFDGTDLHINGTTNAGDIVRVVYSAGSYINPIDGLTDPFVENDADLSGIVADSVSIFLESSNRVYRLQSVAIDTTFDRFDIREIGNKEVVARGTRDITNRITLGRILEDYSVEEILRGKAGEDYGILDIRELSDELNLIIKVYEDNNKTTFKLGYKFTDLAPVGIDAGIPVNDYVTRGVTLEGEQAFVTSVNAIL